MRETEEQGSARLRSPLRRATRKDARALAELIEYAGDGIPGYLWSRSAKEGQPPIEVGTERVLREEANFSYRNAIVVEEELGTRLPEDVQVRAVEETADTIYLVLPSSSPVEEGGELSDQDLEAVAGGLDTFWGATCLEEPRCVG